MAETMWTNRNRRLVLRLCVAGGLAMTAGVAQAQNVTSGAMRPQVTQDPNSQPKKAALPPALPGSKPGQDEAAPSDRTATDMNPNDALFDAINRGDAGAAKDALNRGADIDSRNILGLSPLELSVDLGRNDISFLLLSMRGGGSSSGAAPVASAAPARPALTRAQARAAAQPQRQVTTSVKVVAPQRPQLFAGNGGAPVPQAGFLGFGGAK